MKKIIVLAAFCFLLVVGLSGCKKEEPTPTVYYSDWIQVDLKVQVGNLIDYPQIT